MPEDTYQARIIKYIDPRFSNVNGYNMSVIGVSRFECNIETNDLELLNELTKVLMEFAERKINEFAEELAEEEGDGDD